MKYAVAASAMTLYQSSVSPFLFVGDIYEAVHKAKEIGYDAAEIALPSDTSLDAGRMCDFCGAEGIAIATIGTGTCAMLNKCYLGADDAASRRMAVEKLKGFAALASTLNASLIVGEIRGNKGGMPLEVYRAHLKDSMLRVVEACEKYNVNVFFETLNRYEKDAMNSVDELLAFMDECDTDRIKIHVDTYHMNIEEADMVEAIKKCGSRLGHMHMADNTRRYPGQGSLDFKAIMSAAEQAGFSGYYTLECLAQPDGYTAAQNGLVYLKSLW